VKFLRGALAAALAGCAGTSVQPGQGSLPVPVVRQLSVSLIQRLGEPHVSELGSSRLGPLHRFHCGCHTAGSLLYVSDAADDAVYVLGYLDGMERAKITGIDSPSSQCVGAKGDVFIVGSDSGNGTVTEYAPGGEEPLQTYKPGGESIGCSVNANGDLAVTDFDPGSVTIYKRGDSQKSKVYTNGACAYLWTMGYDRYGNLIGAGEDSTINVCAVLARAKTMTTLSTRGITINSPNGTMWDGKYIVLGDQEAGGECQTGLVQATLSGSTLSSKGETILMDTCDGSNADVVNPFVVGKRNTPVNEHQGTVVLGGNSWCSAYALPAWAYPNGGDPIMHYQLDFEPSGWSVSSK
jgi:hypothetical protein